VSSSWRSNGSAPGSSNDAVKIRTNVAGVRLTPAQASKLHFNPKGSLDVDVAFGSKTVLTAPKRHFRHPNNGHRQIAPACLKRAMNKHARRDAHVKSKPPCDGLRGSVPGTCSGSAVRHCQHGEGDLN
jgi:hypothetical protein